MTDIVTRNCLIGMIGGFPSCPIRPASMHDGITLPVYNVDGTIDEAALSEEGTPTGRIVELPRHSGTFDVISGTPTAYLYGCAENLCGQIIEESVYVEL